jgi:hypothetical protein
MNIPIAKVARPTTPSPTATPMPTVSPVLRDPLPVEHRLVLFGCDESEVPVSSAKIQPLTWIARTEVLVFSVSVVGPHSLRSLLV